jgi:YD repeat-containing protein
LVTFELGGNVACSGAGLISTVTSTARPTAARTATFAYNTSTYTLTAKQTSGTSTRNTKWVKNSATQLVKITDATGKDAVFGYGSGRLTSITAPGGAVTTIGYDGSTRKVTSVSQANTTAGSPGTSVTRFAYASGTQTLMARPNTNQSSAVSAVPG